MPIATPFHEKTLAHCSSMRWKDWAGYYAVCAYKPCHEYEYLAIRHRAALIDISPLFKYEIKGPDAGTFCDHILSRSVSQFNEGQVGYVCWCDHDGYVIDDGTVVKWSDQHYRLTSADPNFAWLEKFSAGFDVHIEDVSHSMAALSLQGPQSRFILCRIFRNDVSVLRYFRAMTSRALGFSVDITRTGYTGDLGFELWVDRSHAHDLYEILMTQGSDFGIDPCGLDAMDMARLEAGLIMNGVEYQSSLRCYTDERKSTPFELNLQGCVDTKRDVDFIGKKALIRHSIAGPRRILRGIEVDWSDTEALFDHHGLPPEVEARAWRDGRPIYDRDGNRIGYATSGTWSPILKKNIAIAHIKPRFAEIGKEIMMEITVEYAREKARARVCSLPFFNPQRKRS